MDSSYSHHRSNHRSNHHNSNYQPPLTAAESQFRILCPGGKAGGVIGKGGAVIRQLRDDTGARIRIVEDHSSSHSDERVILIANPINPNPNPNLDPDLSIAQGALIKVFERIIKVDEERGENNNSKNDDHSNGDDSSNVICRLLIGINQVESILCRGGKVLDNIRQDSCAQIRVLNRDCLPPCALSGDELVQITGNFQSVKKALLLVSSCLQEHPRGFFTSPASENFGPNHRMIIEEDVVFKLLCPAEKAGKLIGKGGFIIRGIQTETGASIKINETITIDSDERLVVISARESEDLRRSPAQDAFMRVHSRISEIGYEPLAAVVARLLVPSQQIGCLMGKGGFIVNEMRRSTGATIRIFGRDQGPKISSNHEVVQVVGNMQTVSDALFQITSRIRESVFPPRPHPSQVNSSPYSNTYQELPSPSFRPRHDQVSPGRYHGNDDRSFSQRPTHPYSLSRGTERISGAVSEHDHYHYNGDRAHLPPYAVERPSSPNSWYPQAVNNEHPGRYSDSGPGHSRVVTSNSQSGQMQMATTVEIVVPQTLLPHVYGEKRINLGHLTQFSGADVVVHDPKPGATEGRVILSGTPAQLHTAQSLVQAFIFCGLDF